MDGRRAALAALVAFLGLTVVATVLGGSRPALHQGVAPAVVQCAGYGCALAGAVLLLGRARSRGLGWAVLGALAVLLGLEVAVDGGGANIGAGAVRLLCLLAVVVATVRLARPSATAGRR